MHMWFMTRDRFPKLRVEVTEIFLKELPRLGHRIDFIMPATKTEPVINNDAWKGIQCRLAMCSKRTSRFSLTADILRDFWNDISTLFLWCRKPLDVLVVKDKYVSAVFALVLAKLRRKPFVLWLSFPYPEAWVFVARTGSSAFPWVNRVRGWFTEQILYRLLLKRCTHAFVQSEQMLNDIRRKGIPSHIMTPVPMGVNLDDVSKSLPTTETRPSGPPRLVYLGTLARRRRVDFLVRMLSIVHKTIPTAMLQLVGGGNDQSDTDLLHSEVRRLGLSDHVQITGWIDRDKSWSYISQADVCLSPFAPLPILESTSPTKLIEYMAFARPVVATVHPEQRRVLADSGGGYCVPYIEDAMAEAVVKILSDPKHANEMGKAGQRWVKQHRNYQHLAALVEKTLLRWIPVAGTSN